MNHSIKKFNSEIHRKNLQKFLNNYCNQWTDQHNELYEQLYQGYCIDLINRSKTNKSNNVDMNNEKLDLYFCQNFINEFKKKYNITPIIQKEIVDNPYHQPQESFKSNISDVVQVQSIPQQSIPKNTSTATEQSYSKYFEVNVPKEPFILDIPEKDNIEYHIILDSRDRNIINYPYPDNFTINIENTLKNIYSIKIDRIITPNWCIFTEEPYTLLLFKELDNVFVYNGSNPLYNKIFTLIYPEKIIRERKHISQVSTNSQKLFKTNTLASLTRFSPTYLKPDGTGLRTPTDIFEIIETLECFYENIKFYRLRVKNIFRNLSVEYYNWLNQICKVGDKVYIINERDEKIEFEFMTLGSLNDFLNGEFIIDIYENSNVEVLYNLGITSDKLIFYEEYNQDIDVKNKFVGSFIFLKKISFFISCKIVLQEYNARTIPNQIVI